MDLPTYTNIWRIEKRLYKLYDLRLPMPLPLVQIGVFLGVFVPWIVLLRLVGIPFESPWHVLYIVPPGVLTWLATRPVIEGKRLTELVLSQSRYLSEPRTWCRLTPIREPREVVIVARVWRRAEAPATAPSAERAAGRTRRRRKAAAEPAPALLASPATSPVPPSLGEYAAHRDVHAPEIPAPVVQVPAVSPAVPVPAAPRKPWRRTTRDISHEDDVQPVPGELEHPPATPELGAPAAASGSGERPPASDPGRPGVQAETPRAAPPTTRPDIPQQSPANVRRAAEEIANGTPAPHRPPPAPTGARGGAQPPGSGVEPGVGAAGRAPGGAGPAAGTGPPAAPGHGEPVWSRGEARRDVRWESAPPAGRSGAAAGQEAPAGARSRPAEGVPAPRRSGGEAGDKKVAGTRKSAQPAGPQHPVPPAREPAAQPPAAQPPAARPPAVQPPAVQPPAVQPPAVQPPADDPGVRETRRDAPRPWAPRQRGQEHPPAARPQAPGPTRPDIPMVPDAFGTRPNAPTGPPPAEPRPADAPAADAPAAETRSGEVPRMEAPRPWSEGLSKPRRPASTDAPAWPAAPETRAAPANASAPVEQVPVQEQAPPREVRSQPASPVRPRPLPPPPAPPPSAPAITPPDPEHEVSGGGLRRLFHAVGGGQGDVDAEYQQRLQQPFRGTRHVVVLGCTGGAGQTVTALMLGHTFAQHNGEPVVALDVNPGPGALARRTRSDTNETLTGLITRADQVSSLTAMRRYTSQAKSGLDVIAAGKNPLQALDDRDYALAIRTLDRFYSVTLLDAAAAVVARVLPYADQVVLVAPASADAPRAIAMTYEWLDGHGYEELRSRAVTVINGVSRRSMDDVEQAEAVARGRCRALVRIPWDDHLSMDRAPRNELKSLRTPTRRAYLALAGVVAGGFGVMPERYQELQQEQEATR